ncbi:MAG: penicillin-binding transpeptidase domain-containing protein [Lachnospiraceae bacterium]|jgi:peptidoglycan glycosyltransferase|nr:penicillin-binding transpeptidase domain-containing protein [Lachnospiraceae bacterium]MEE3460888.1 penicillin-binding transpeptidase domain-containing protein [Lachnospiraceae bacterium]
MRTEDDKKKTGNTDRKKTDRYILLTTYIFTILFFVMAGFLVKFVYKDSPSIINNSYNKRDSQLEKYVKRGKIMSSDGLVLAETVRTNGKSKRTYPQERLYAHVVGRTSYGKAGLESAEAFPLLTSHINPVSRIIREFQGKKLPGDTVVSTLNSKVQKAAYDALGSYKGAAIAMDPNTGKILAMVSKPDFDPNNISSEWEELNSKSADDSALLNRATQGLYPPGSTFKLLTCLEYMRENNNYQNYSYDCKGSDIFNGAAIRCFSGEVHGNVDLMSSVAESCNCSFANIGMKLDLKKFHKFVTNAGYNSALPVDFEYSKSRYEMKTGADSGEIVGTSIGQGKTMVTPLLNVMITSAIANNGIMMRPYLVDRVKSRDNSYKRKTKPAAIKRIAGVKKVKALKSYMETAANTGTASLLASLSYPCAGKTGTAEFDSSGTSHAWFVGYAPADDPKIAVAVVVEGAGTGSTYAVPVARSMFAAALGY